MHYDASGTLDSSFLGFDGSGNAALVIESGTLKLGYKWYEDKP